MEVDLRGLQGNIFWSYGRTYRVVRHLVLRVVEPAAARAALASMVDGNRSTPEVTGAERPPKDDDLAWCLNVAFTWRGLEALGLPRSSLDTFPPEFRQGMVARAARLGDVGDSSPEHWIAGLGDAANVHVLVTIHGREPDDLTRVSAQVVAAHKGRAFAPVARSGPPDGSTFPGDAHERRVHFGYRDGISQPRFKGIHDDAPVPGQPFTPVGAILLGHPAPLPAVEWRVPEPYRELGFEGTFNAFRVLGQDVAGFEDYLRSSAERLGYSAEEVAAKLCGRWRDGAPLVLAPTEAESKDFPEADLNRFGYQETDADGAMCPIGSHIRRANPRDARIVQRGSNDVRGVLRRGMPFGPRYATGPQEHDADPSEDDRAIPRGLVGNFICASLAAQFEAMQSDWLNLGLQDPRVTGTNDPLAGANDGVTASFEWTTSAGERVVLRELPSFVRTLGGAYCFVPTIRAIRWIGEGAWSAVP